MVKLRWIIAAIVASALLVACASSSTPAASFGTSSPGTTSGPPTSTHSRSPSGQSVSPLPAESPVPADSNPPGDIPDNTQFVPYRSKAGGFTISVPEGWSRTTTKDSVTFTDKLNTIVIGWQPTASAPTVSSANANEVPTLRKAERAFRLTSVKSTTLPAGRGVLISYAANSDPNPVTGKQYRLDVLRYELFHNGTELIVGLRSPVGSDNVDPWRIVTESIKWS
jgi:hypothetical protein